MPRETDKLAGKTNEARYAETDKVSVKLSDSLEGGTDRVRGQTDAELLPLR